MCSCRDSELRGFGVRVKPSGAAAFLIQYRTPHDQTRRHAIGKVGSLTPDQARREAAARLADISTKGADPSADRKAARAALTLAELCDEYLARAAAGEILGRNGRPIKASTLEMDRSRIERHLKPLLGTRPLASITLADVERLQADITAGRTSKPRNGRGGATTGGRGVASRTIGMLGTILQYALRRKIIATNPARGAKRHADGRADRALSLEEIATLGAAMREAAEAGESATAIAAVRFLVLSGFRRMECLALPWEAVDAKGRCVRSRRNQERPAGTAHRPWGS